MSESAIALLRSIDVTIFIFSVAVVWFVIASGLVRSRVTSSLGRWMIVTGIIFLLVLEGAELTLKLITSREGFLSNQTFLPVHVPMVLQWLLTRGGFLLLVTGLLVGLLRRRRSEAAMASEHTQMIQAAQKSVLLLEARFRSLLDVTTSPSYCWAFDPPLKLPVNADELVEASKQAFLVECNAPYVSLFKGKTTADLIGRRFGANPIFDDVDAYRAMCAKFIAENYRLSDFEVVLKGENAEDSARSISITGIVEDNHLLRIWGSDTDLADLRATESALVRRRNFQDLVAGISSYMIMTPIDRSSDIVEHCLREICDFIDVDRSSLIWIDWTKRKGYVNFRWEANLSGAPREITSDDFPFFAQNVREGRVVKVNNLDELDGVAATDRERLKAMGVKSFAALPLCIADDVVGVVSFADSKKTRDWSDQDILDLRVLAELFANFVSRLKSHIKLEEALKSLEEAKERLEEENVYLREEIDSTHGFDEIVGSSESILRALRMVEMVAVTETPVLILGETGTGKELFARAIHERSGRSSRPLVKVNCATLPANLIESELFGYEKGAFTGAVSRKRGRFDLAHGSTLFLDEFGELPLDLQTKLLRVLQEGEFDRLGGTETIKVDVRLIVATNHDLAADVRNGSFRSDLYYRVNTFPINIPPLRNREGDIELLAMHFLSMYAKRMGRDVEGISASMMRQLISYDWPGNVRELEGLIQRALISSHSQFLELPEPLSNYDDRSSIGHKIISSTLSDLNAVEREHILNVLEETRWKISGPEGAASRLGLPPSTLRSKMKKLEISKPH